MKSSAEQDLAELSQLVVANCGTRGTTIVAGGEGASKLVLLWLPYLRTSHATGTADCLIDGTLSALREGIACTALGLVRPALNSLRLQIDLSLAWLYFKDHPVEWRRVQSTGEGFKLKSELSKYFSETISRYSDRFGLLKDIKTRTLEDPYRLLSAHLHGQNELVLPRIDKPKDIVAPPKAQDEFLQLQRDCSEYLNDVFWSFWADSWTSIPAELKTTLEARFKTLAQRAYFFSNS